MDAARIRVSGFAFGLNEMDDGPERKGDRARAVENADPAPNERSSCGDGRMGGGEAAGTSQSPWNGHRPRASVRP